jgi:mono/diheme cytochrome c family protein
VIKRRIMLSRFGVLSIGLSAACLALACGNDNAPEEPEEPEVVDECELNPYLEDCPGNEEDPPPASGGTGNVPSGGSGGGQGSDPPPQEDLDRAQVENILRSNCGACHGSQLTELQRQGGMNYIDDIAELAEQGKIRPLDSEGSPIIQKMRAGLMPPSGDPVSRAEIDIIANFINNPDKWPGATPVTCNDNPAVSFDRLYQDIARDLQAQEDEDRPFTRYVSLDNRVAAGVCATTALDTDRHALTKLMNMLSIDPSIATPTPVNDEETLFRIDLRDMQWNREIVVDGVAFADVWEAIIAANEYAVPFVGQDADEAREDALTDVPFMFLDSMLDQAAIGNLYYAIIGVDINQTLDVFVSDVLGIDVAANLEEEELIRAGTTKSRISRQDRLVEGHQLEDRPGVYYQSFDFNDVQNESIFQNPFGFNEGGREAIFTLPNGMLAYLIADDNGNFVQDSDILLDTSQSNFRAITSVSCSSCHASGFIPVVDEVREVVLDTGRLLIEDGTLNQEQLEQLSNVYLPKEAFARRIEEDSDAFYLNALRRASLPIAGAEPISTVFQRFDRDMTLREAAGDLGLTADELEQELNTLEPELGVLRRGSIDRDDFTAFYVASLCELSSVNDNQPDVAVCDAAFAALDD